VVHHPLTVGVDDRAEGAHDVYVPAERPPSTQDVGYGLSGIIAVESHGEVCVLKLAGDVDAVMTRRVADVVDTILSRRPRTLIIDLRRVTFVASVAAHLVVESPRRTGTEIRFVAARDAGIWETVPGISTAAMAVFATLDEALASNKPSKSP
jgi:anti-anti-sigma factor